MAFRGNLTDRRPRMLGGPDREEGLPMTTFLSRFLSSDDAATAIEYGLIAAGIALAIITAVNTLGTTVLNSQFDVVKNALNP